MKTVSHFLNIIYIMFKIKEKVERMQSDEFYSWQYPGNRHPNWDLEQELASKPHPACCLFLYSQQAKNGFYVFIWLKKILKNSISWHVKYIWNSNGSVHK